MRGIAIVLLFLAGTSSALCAQSVAQRVSASDGPVQVVFPSRPSACGDGATFIGKVLGSNVLGRSTYQNQPCVHGPARALATVIDGEVTRIQTYVGLAPAQRPDVRTLTVSGSEASAWLAEIVTHGSSRIANEALLPLILADAADPWPILLRVARDDNRPRDVRGGAITWLGNEVVDHLGLSDDRAQSDDEEMRNQAVFLISQRPASESVPELVRLARTEKNASVRRAAIFWLGQTGDPQATAVYAQLLGMQ